MSFERIREGDVVTRLLGGCLPMRLRVCSVDETLIYCGASVESAWMFDRRTGAEVDDDLGWGPAYGRTGSFLVQRADEETR